MEIRDIQECAAPILKRHDAVEAYVFGSAARGEATSESDIDILVKFRKVYSLFEFVRAKRELREALNREVDLVDMEALRKEMKPFVNKDKIRIV